MNPFLQKPLSPLLVIGLLLLSSCYTDSNVYLKSSASSLPATQATVPIEVFHHGEAFPNRAYKKLPPIEMQAAQSNTYGSVISRLKGRARQMGADAIVLVQQSQYTDCNPNESFSDVLDATLRKAYGDSTETQLKPKSYQRVYAIPIIYLDKLDYLVGRLQKIEIRNSKDSLLATISAQLNGKQYSIHGTDPEARWYFDNSHEVIRYQESSEWKSRYLDDGTLERKKTIDKRKGIYKRYRIKEAAAITARIESVDKKRNLDLINYTYDEDNQLVLREFIIRGNPFRREVIHNEKDTKVSSYVEDIYGKTNS